MSAHRQPGAARIPTVAAEPPARGEVAQPTISAGPLDRDLQFMGMLSPGQIAIGGRTLVLVARPCSTAELPALTQIAEEVKAAGFKAIHAGCYVPNPWIHNLEGVDAQGLEILAQLCRQLGLALIIEVIAPEDMAMAVEYADILQVGARNMENYPLLHALGTCDKPVLLKRGRTSTLQELCAAAEYVRSRGNQQIVLCERGIRTFEAASGDVFDVSAIPALRELTSLPILADPCHASGGWTHVRAMCMAAVAAGVDGLLLDVCSYPAGTWTEDVPQVPTAELRDLAIQLRAIANAVGRDL